MSCDECGDYWSTIACFQCYSPVCYECCKRDEGEYDICPECYRDNIAIKRAERVQRIKRQQPKNK